MSTYDNSSFPVDGLEWWIRGGPAYQTRVVTWGGGSEQRNGLVGPHARRRFEISTGNMINTRREALYDFFVARRGASDSFRFRDPFDYTASGAPLVSVSGGYQLVKRYTVGATTYDRPITKPISGSLSFVGASPTGVDYETGVCTFSGSPATSWAGQFEIQARFESDEYEEANFFTDAHTVAVAVVEAFDSDFPVVSNSTPAALLTYTFPCAVEVGRRRRQRWSTYNSTSGIEYFEEREPVYSDRRARYEGTAFADGAAELTNLLSLFLVCRGRRSAFQYDSLDVRFASDALPLVATGYGNWEADVSFVEV